MEGNYLSMWNKAQEKGSMHLLYDDMANQCMLILCLICMTELNPAPVWAQRAPLHCSQPFLFNRKAENGGWPHRDTWPVDCTKLNFFACSHCSND